MRTVFEYGTFGLLITVWEFLILRFYQVEFYRTSENRMK